MELNEKDIRKIIVLGMMLILAVLVFLLVKPLLLSIVGGLILAYVFFPIYRRIQDKIKLRNLSAALVTLIALMVIFVPLWFMIPILIQQSFQIFVMIQNLNVAEFLHKILPNLSDQFIVQLSVTFDTFVSKLTSGGLNSLANTLLDFPKFLLQAFIIGFVFFFTLRDSDHLRNFVSEISPFDKLQEVALTQKFKNLTDSIIYGQIVVGLIQGIFAGLGFIIFGVPNALFLTSLAIMFAIIPIVGPGLIWIPLVVFMFAADGNSALAFGFLLYNLLIVSTIDNVVRTYLVSRRADVPVIIIFIGMIGGLFIFGILGLILGPIILTYFLVFLKAYKEKTLESLFKK